VVQFGIATISGHQKVPVPTRQIAMLEVGMETGSFAETGSLAKPLIFSALQLTSIVGII
jgi:hypothetical protein